MVKKTFIVAIDGASSTGKSTLAKGIAKAMQFVYVDSGAMYRGITLYAQQQQWLTKSYFDIQTLLANLDDIQLDFIDNNLILNGLDVSNEIRGMAVSSAVSKVAAISEVRAFLVAQQRIIGVHQHVVMDGRDIGTVVFPNADLKLFLTADAHTRAKRRFEELRHQDPSITFEVILENINQRDYLDSTRSDSPLEQAKDAIALDATQNTVEEMLQHALGLVKKRMFRR